MKNKIFKYSAVALISCSLFMNTSCSDELDLAPIDYPGFGSFWENETQFTGNITALAQMFRANYSANILFWAGELRGGQFTTALINGSGALQEDVINNNYDIAHTQFSNFMNTPGFVADLNELIYECENVSEDVLPTNVKEGLLGMAYGWRAYIYFQVYKMWGGAVLRLEPDVIFGNYDPTSLYKARSTAQQTLDQIKSDIETSLTHFNSTTWQFRGGTNKDYYWSKAATEMLAGEVYLWSGKVTTGDHAAGGASDVAQAKQYFSNVINNYGYQLYNNWLGIWTTPHNSESIYAMCFSNETDAYYGGFIQGQVTWSKAAGAGTQAWSVQGPTGFDKTSYDSATGTYANASRFQYYSTNPASLGTEYTNWVDWNPSPNRFMWKNALYYQYDQEDGRLASWFPQWYITDEELDTENNGANQIYSVANFDPTKYDMEGSFILKFIPKYVTGSTSLTNANDQFIYRLTLAYCYMAEIANYEGNYSEIATWINPIRQRAYGANWDVNKYGFQPSSFAENEAQILREKNKEFMMEGQRWWDLRRMTTVKDGSQTDHMVFQPQGCIGYGLDPVTNPWMVEAGAKGSQSVIQTSTPVLTTSEEYKLLWPIDRGLLSSDPEVVQNPGYASDED